MPRIAAALLALLLAASPATAQESGRPGNFDYYVLALSWSPQYCAVHGQDADARGQCVERKLGFVAHGLWPQDQAGNWPASCRPAARVPNGIVNRLLPVMPSERLIQHEWAIHGTCSGLDMDDYFDALGQAFRKVQIPLPLSEPHMVVTTGVQRIKQLFAEANPGLTDAMVTVTCAARDRAISEIHICLDKNLAFRSCGRDVVDNCNGIEGRFRPVD